jgi:RNA polymerase sigma factor (sigma-70 family)
VSDVCSITSRKMATRDRLVLDHLKLPKQIAKKLSRSLPPCFELDDLVQAGMLGLLEAASQYDPQRFPGVAFGAFARRRIQGEIKDSIGMTTAGTRRTTRRRRWEEATRPPILEHREPAPNYDGESKDTPDPHARADNLIEIRERRDLAREAIGVLPRRLATVIELHYSGKELKQIAGRRGLKVGAARVSQLHTAALAQMREHFRLRGLKRAA